MQSLALAWLVLSLTNSALMFSLVSVCQFVPILLLGMIAGVVADRLPKRRLIVTTQVLAATLATILAVLTVTDRIQLWQIFVLALGLGVVNAFDMPARRSFVVEMVGKADLANAFALGHRYAKPERTRPETGAIPRPSR